jgi:hypothetical protein
MSKMTEFLQPLDKVTANRWYGGNDETPCGHGSTLASTEEIRAALPGLLKEYGITSVVDAGCGDLNWVKEVDWTGISYTGVDLMQWGDIPEGFGEIIRMDITTQKVWACDLIICRDVLIHLPTSDILRTLALFRLSGSSLLLTTSYPGAPTTRELPCGYCPVDLENVPFSMGEPLEKIPERRWCRYMGLWRLQE